MEGSESGSLCRSLVIRVSGMSGGDGDIWLLFGIPEMRVFWSESRLPRCPSGKTLPCFYAGSASSGCFHGRTTCLRTLGPGADILLVRAGRTVSKRGMETRVMSSSEFYSYCIWI